ncbi:MAG: TRAP transporter small permease subunit, partial [Alphaproteobacteria bacterium]|nr:TRAP transporter small permease subunit [Alphaproteobacteria bacterium]
MAARAEMIQRAIENVLVGVSTLIILFVLFFVLAEVVARYVFNAPLPGHLEGAELLLPMIVFGAVSYTQARNGHVGMTLVIDALPPKIRRRTDIVILVLSMLTCAVLAYFGTKYAYQ